MNPLDAFELEQKMLTELKNLFEVVPPFQLRRNLEDLYFQYVTTEEHLELAPKFNSNFYFLLNFLNEMDLLQQKDQ